LVDWIHEARSHAVGLIINGGAFSHTSIALADAVTAVALPMVESPSVKPLCARSFFAIIPTCRPWPLAWICGFGAKVLWAGAGPRCAKA